MPIGKGKKEPCFFNRPNFHEQWSWYARFFKDAPPQTSHGEGSTIYSAATHEKQCRERILALYPQIKLIFIARDPFDRIESSYRHTHWMGSKLGVYLPFSLEEAIRKPNPIIRKPNSIIEDARYFTRLENYRQHIPANQILMIFLEELMTDPHQVLTQCFEFLGVDPSVRINNPSRRLNKGNEKLYDTPKLRDMRRYVINPETSLALKKLPLDIQDQFLNKLGLRKQFTGEPLEWSSQAERYAVEMLHEDIQKFLEMNGKPFDFWPRFAKAVSACHDTN